MDRDGFPSQTTLLIFRPIWSKVCNHPQSLHTRNSNLTLFSPINVLFPVNGTTIHFVGPNRNLGRIHPPHSPEPPIYTSLSLPPNYFSIYPFFFFSIATTHTFILSHQDFSDSLQIIVPVSSHAHSTVFFIKPK
uniref:Uncharacterized protein n=1 Tax=Rousettus aegyptiacus TaxID=9407 RepID=A0A7J8KB47_ROUAE|nr:hypothetical protein HJG63_007922 [Rousettus aegyptiacus]